VASMHQSAQFASTWRVPVEGALARGPMEQEFPAGGFRKGHGGGMRRHPHHQVGGPFTPSGMPDEVMDEDYEWDNDEYGEEGDEDDDDSAEELHGDTGNFGDEPDGTDMDGGVDEGAVKKKSSWRFWDKKK